MDKARAFAHFVFFRVDHVMSCARAGPLSDQEQMAAELERSKASVARLLKERDDLEEKLKALGKELKQAINEKSVQVGG